MDELQNAEERLARLAEEREEKRLRNLKEELEEAPLRENPSPITAQSIPLAQISLGVNARQKLGEVEDLARSISQRGLNTALKVRPTPGGERAYELVSGHRRYAALSLIARLSEREMEARCEVQEMSEAQRFAHQLLENYQEPLPDKDWARGIRLLLKEEPEMSAEELVKSLGVPLQKVRKYLRLSELPAPVRARLEAGDLSFTAADLIRRAHKSGRLDEQEAEAMAERVVGGELSTAQMREETRAARAPEAPENYQRLSDELDESRWAADQQAREDFKDRDATAAGLGQGRTAPRAEKLLPLLEEEESEQWVEQADPPAPQREQSGLGQVYLLGLLLSRDAPDQHLGRLGISREGCFDYARGLPAEVLIKQLNALGRELLREDEGAPLALRESLERESE